MPTLGGFLYAAIYQQACRFANIERFMDIASVDTDLTVMTDAESAQRTMCDIAKRLGRTDTVRTDEEAARSLAAKDLALVARSDLVDVGVKGSVSDRLDRHGPLIQERLTSIGLPVGEAPLRIVDEFPAPFDQFDWSAFAPDREDEENFHIEQGVYFRRDRLRPMYSEALFAYEVVHTVTGR